MKLILLDKTTKVVKQIMEVEDKAFWLNEFSYYEEYQCDEDVSNLTYEHKLVNGKFVLDEELVKAKEESRLAEAKKHQSEFYKSERKIALEIQEDATLGLNHATESDMQEVRTYLQAIKPKEVVILDLPIRPKIMNELYPLQGE